MDTLAIVPPKPYGASSQGVLFSCTHIVSGKMVDIRLGEHRIVLEFTLAERRSVASDDDQLGLARSEAFEGGLVTESD